MFKKITILALILLLSVSFVVAANINDIKTVDGFTKKSDNFAINGDFGLSITNYDESINSDILFKNDTDYTVNVSNISNYTDKTVKHVGCLEIVDINGEKIAIEIYNNGTDINKCYEYMLELNKINDFKPITP